ncbi:MAG: segregation/condensation protein A [candidate division Zixibacteria bacterium]|jgi:segregation and condensation protein A|nr:segregation/condensation protein A [candidate division Zixibacteria bacterium]
MTREELFAIDPITGEESLTYSVRLEKFEGPLDLLLYLIRKSEIDIYDISISKITGQYLEYIGLMRMLDLDVAGEFIIMAATLIRIKSRLLLPAQQGESEEDPREELILALLEYKKFREASGILRSNETKERDILTREDFSIVDTSTDEEFVLEATVFDLLGAFKKVLDEYSREDQHSVEREDIKVEDCMARILSQLESEDGLEFSLLFQGTPIKLLIIVTFMAILELVKRNLIFARQVSRFGEIRVYRRETSDA